jgi:gluconolactonase
LPRRDFSTNSGRRGPQAKNDEPKGLDGVSIFKPQGKLIGRIDLPERCANLRFGGRQRNRLFMCGSTSVYSLFVNTQGVAGG